MRLELLCEFDFAYDEHGVAWVSPGGGPTRAGFGALTGRVTGRLEGPLRCFNVPRVREDGVPMPSVHGVIETGQGPVLFEMHGYAGALSNPGDRPVTASVHFQADADSPHAWLNHVVAVHEGFITPLLTARFPCYVCLPDNETATS